MGCVTKAQFMDIAAVRECIYYASKKVVLSLAASDPPETFCRNTALMSNLLHIKFQKVRSLQFATGCERPALGPQTPAS